MLPTPAEMIAHLDLHVHGQARAKQDLAVAVYNHYLSQAHREEEGVDLGRFHILLIGPTGVGKTFLVRTLADFLGVPLGVASAAGLVESGYRGHSVDSVLRSLMARAGGDPMRAEKGIVFIDEIDKIRSRQTGSRDVSGEGVQNALLAFLDGLTTRGADRPGFAEIDTGRLLFVCTGAFIGLESIVAERLGKGAQKIGFHARPRETPSEFPDQPVYETLCQAGTGDLVAYGLIPEFVGRFATVSVLHELSRGALRGILAAGMEQSALARQVRLAALHGIALVFGDEAMDAIATEAAALNTGARGLARLLGKVVDAVDHRWPELADEGVTEVRVTAGTVLRGEPPELVRAEPRLPRMDRRLRALSLRGLPPAAPNASDTDTTGWSTQRLRGEIERLKLEKLGWAETEAGAREWWVAFEKENAGREALIHRLAEKLSHRRASIGDFFLASANANTDSIMATLHYLDYMRLKRGRVETRPGLPD